MSSEIIFSSEVSHAIDLKADDLKVSQNKNQLDEFKKNIAGQVLTCNSKNFH